MTNSLQEVAKKRLRTSFEALSAREQQILRQHVEGIHISRNTNRDFEERLTFGQRLADRVATFGGSWTFIMLFAAILFSWIILNSLVLARRAEAFDPYPYILLNLVLSMLAAIQAPIIMMSQNRQAAKDRLTVAHDYEVNLKAELEIASLHEKFDELREHQWAELVAMQQEQIRLLMQLLDARTTPVKSG
ncbi:MAG TPA: DUF1003 domain-containing protein [Herpetosiphonaceae bacterium]